MVFKSNVCRDNKEELKTKSYHENKKIAKEMRDKNIVINSYPI